MCGTYIGDALVANHEPIYYLPSSGDYSIDITSSNLNGQDTEELALFGQGMAADVSNIKLDRGMDDQLSLSGGQKLGFKAGEAESPDIKLAVEAGGKDYQVDIIAGDLVASRLSDNSVYCAWQQGERQCAPTGISTSFQTASSRGLVYSAIKVERSGASTPTAASLTTRLRSASAVSSRRGSSSWR